MSSFIQGMRKRKIFYLSDMVDSVEVKRTDRGGRRRRKENHCPHASSHHTMKSEPIIYSSICFFIGKLF